MQSIKLHHRLAFHALTASIVLNIVFGVMLHKITNGAITVTPGATGILSLF